MVYRAIFSRVHTSFAKFRRSKRARPAILRDLRLKLEGERRELKNRAICKSANLSIRTLANRAHAAHLRNTEYRIRITRYAIQIPETKDVVWNSAPKLVLFMKYL
jgi:hypothetical protein